MQSPLNHNGKLHLPVSSGQYVVGCTDVMVGPDFHQGCFFRLYYPSEVKNVYEYSSMWPKWIPHPKYVEGYTNTLWLRYIPFFGHKMLSLTSGNLFMANVVDAEPVNKRQFPVIVFSHGLTASRNTYSVVCSELSSHGFIVAAVEHRDGSACATYNLIKDDLKQNYVEDWIPYIRMTFEKNDLPLRKQQLPIRVQECRKTLDILDKINNGESIDHLYLSTMDLSKFKGIMDLTKPIISGHSYGGATTLRVLAADNRFKLGFALDAWMWPMQDELDLPEKINQPILFINTEAFQTTFSLNIMKRFIERPPENTERRVVTLRGSVHLNQADVPFLVHRYLRIFVDAYSSIDPHLAMDLNNRMIILYLRKHLGQTEDEKHSEFVEKNQNWVLEGI